MSHNLSERNSTSNVNKSSSTAVRVYNDDESQILDTHIEDFLRENTSNLNTKDENLTKIPQPQLANQRDYRAAIAQIKSLKQANQGLREQLPQSKELSDELKASNVRNLNKLLNHFGMIEEMYPRVLEIQEQMEDMSIRLIRAKEDQKNLLTMVDLEAFKLATRNEFCTLIEFKLDQYKETFSQRCKKIEERQKELGLQCAEIMPAPLFKDYLRRQMVIDTKIETITNQLLPGHLTKAENMIQGKIDRFECGNLVQIFLKEALANINGQQLHLHRHQQVSEAIQVNISESIPSRDNSSASSNSASQSLPQIQIKDTNQHSIQDDSNQTYHKEPVYEEILLEREQSRSSVNARPNMSHLFQEQAISSIGKQSDQPKILTSMLKLKDESKRKHDSSDRSDWKTNMQMQTTQLKTDLRDSLNQIQSFQEQLNYVQKCMEKNEYRMEHYEMKQLELEQHNKKSLATALYVESILPELRQVEEKIKEKLANIESELNMNQSSMPNSPTQKFLERRIILSERAILKLDQEFNLLRISKKQNMSYLQNQVEELKQVTQEFAPKFDYLHTKMTDDTKILINQIDVISKELAKVSQTVSEKLVDITKETQLYHAELTRTQTINRDLTIDIKKTKGLLGAVSSTTANEDSIQNKNSTYHVTRTLNKTQDSMAFDSVMFSTMHDEEKKWVDPVIVGARTTSQGRFWQSIDRMTELKPLTTRIVPPLLTSQILSPKREQAEEDSVHSVRSSQLFEKQQLGNPKLNQTRSKIQNMISQHLSVRSQRSNHSIDNDIKPQHKPVHRLQLKKFEAYI